MEKKCEICEKEYTTEKYCFKCSRKIESDFRCEGTKVGEKKSSKVIKTETSTPKTIKSSCAYPGEMLQIFWRDTDDEVEIFLPNVSNKNITIKIEENQLIILDNKVILRKAKLSYPVTDNFSSFVDNIFHIYLTKAEIFKWKKLFVSSDEKINEVKFYIIIQNLNY